MGLRGTEAQTAACRLKTVFIFLKSVCQKGNKNSIFKNSSVDAACQFEIFPV
jgi:hypothetical protein